jgi:polyisoprenoid-binding protein YceI
MERWRSHLGTAKKHAIFLSAATLVAALSASAQSQQVWQIDPNHSSATFAALHNNISLIRGEFTKVGGTVEYDG